MLFGQQDALAYGVHWKDYHAFRTDVHDVCGKHPAVFGWDLGRLGQPANLDGVPFHRMRDWMLEVDRRGGINTVSWHMDNFLNGRDSWSVGLPVVRAILPGGTAHAIYLRKLALFADFARSLQAPGRDQPIELVFRPFHEHTGNWFWWGEKHCSQDEYVALWQFTHHYLTGEEGLTNLLWAYSPDRFRDKAHYLERYPGDAYVDVLGLDEYHHLSAWWKQKDFLRRLRDIVELAEARGKVAALTETGLEAIPRHFWWTKRLLHPILEDPSARKIAWMLVWRNASRSHHFGPYPGHNTAADFIRFSGEEGVGFLGDN
ncbi:MAG: glycosyl hydrolase [Bacteroidota bacterium]